MKRRGFLSVFGMPEPPNWYKDIDPNFDTGENFNIPERECDYCPPGSDPMPTDEMKKLPNGLYRCKNHVPRHLSKMREMAEKELEGDADE